MFSLTVPGPPSDIGAVVEGWTELATSEANHRLRNVSSTNTYRLLGCYARVDQPTTPPPRSAPISLLALVLLSAGLSGCLTGQEGSGGEGLDATIQWTSHGIPHVTAEGWGGLGYGYGYAAARDYLCTIAEEYVTVAGERSRTFGSDGGYSQSSNGQTFTNLESDLFWTLMDENPELIESMADYPDEDLQAVIDGYVAGYNRYLQDTPPADRPEACGDEPWVGEITREDMVRRFNKLSLLASGGFFAPAIVQASPPDGPAAPSPSPSAAVDGGWQDAFPTADRLGVGSNGYAFGSELTANGRGMLLGNPHFPWQGPERFHQLHLTIPGEVDVMGATLHGVPLVLIGFNEHVAWTHTVSTGWRFSIHELTLVPGDPTSYIVDGEVEAMETREVTVDTGDGGNVTHTFYLSRYGPIFDLPVAGGEGPTGVGLRWTADKAYALNDANARNDRAGVQFLRWNQAESFDAFVDALHEVHGIPWVNTIAANPDGRAFYGDISVVPNYDAETIQACNTPVGHALFELMRLPVLDGSRSECAPIQDPRAAQEGILPADEMPSITTEDWLINSNDDHWLPNPEHELTGYSPMIGWGPSERSLRTRMGYVLWQELEAGASEGCELDADVACDQLTIERLQHGLFSNRLYAAEHFLDDVLARTCTPAVALSSDGQVVDLTEACQALSAWDRRATTTSAGLPLFEQFWQATPKTWTVPFDPDDPVHTPRGFLASDPGVRTALADAVVALQGAGIPIDAAAGEARFVERGGERLPLHGARGELGSPSMLVVPFDPDQGYLEPVHGNSYIQAVTWDEDGTPTAEAVLSYSQSPHPDSLHHADQTRLYSQGQWAPLPFTQDEIRADPALESLRLAD